MLSGLVLVLSAAGCGGPTERDAPRPAVTPSASASAADDPMHRAVTTALERQSAALVRGDLAGWLSVAEEGNADVATDLRRRFTSLRAMKVAAFTQAIEVGPLVGKGYGGREEWSVRLDVALCFVKKGCTAERVPGGTETRWVMTPDGARLARFVVAYSNSGWRPQPWEVAALTAVVGRRVVVAGAARASRVRSVVAAADRAAAVADRLAVGGKAQRYLVFLASDKEFHTWYGGVAGWAAGYAADGAEDRVDVVIAIDKVEEVEFILRHELTHAATLARGPEDGTAPWWLVEGIAEYGEGDGYSVGQYGAEIRRFVREAKWKGDLSTIAPGDLEKDWSITAKYGLSFLAVRRLADRHGRAKLLRFFEQVAHRNVPVADAAEAVFGVSLKSLYADCLRYTRDMVGA